MLSAVALSVACSARMEAAPKSTLLPAHSFVKIALSERASCQYLGKEWAMDAGELKS